MSDSNYSFSFTKMPNTFIESSLKEISGSSTKIYVFLCRKIYGWQKSRDIISHSQIKEMTGLSERIIIKSIRELEKSNLIKTIKTGKGKNQKIEYILPINEKTYAAKNDTFDPEEESNTYFFAPLKGSNGAKKSDTKERINIKKEEERTQLSTKSLPDIKSIPHNSNTEKKSITEIQTSEETKTTDEKEGEISSLIDILTNYELHINQARIAIKTKPLDFIKEKVSILEFMLENFPHKIKGKSSYLYNLIFKDWTSEEYNRFRKDETEKKEYDLIQKKREAEEKAREEYLLYEKELKENYDAYIEKECNDYFAALPKDDQCRIVETAKKNIKIPIPKENKNFYESFFRVSFLDLLKSIIPDLIPFNEFRLQKKT